MLFRYSKKAGQNRDFLNSLIVSDEAHFNSNGFANKQNSRLWATENPRVVYPRKLDPLKCTVWCGVSSERILGPYLFGNAAGAAVTVNVVHYRNMLENFLRPPVSNHPKMWFQQDDATAHTAKGTMVFLTEIDLR